MASLPPTDDEDEMPEGEYVDIDDEFPEVEDTPDGGAIVRMDEGDEEEGESAFTKNLAEDIPEPQLQKVAQSLLELFDKDKEARKRRDEQYEEGLKRTGLGDDAPGGADFQGASKVVHPMLTEACVDFAARAMKEIFPTGGPAKDYVTGKTSAEKLERAQRKVSLINWQLTVQCSEFRAELEQLMTQVPMGGGQYLKLGWDKARNRPTSLFVPIDDMLLPYAATNFYTAQRKTHRQYLTQLDYEERVKSGMYRDVDLVPNSMAPEQTLSGEANDKIEGREESSYNEDGLRIVFESYVMLDLGDDDPLADGVAPYIISIDKSTAKVLSIYRNWDEDDESKEELAWFVEYPFIPWRGAYPIGLPHLIGGLSGAATGALRALLDAAHISNSQTMLKLKGGTAGGQNLELQPGQTAEIEGGLNVDDIRKLAMPLPYNPPSPVLFSLLSFLVEAGKGVVRTSMEDIADGNANAPVGTTLAKIEQGAVVYSSIHSRLHDAMGRMLRIMDRLNGSYLDDARLKEEAGELLASRNDFDGTLDVVPVSDPNIFSEAQRYAQIQAVAGRAATLPQLYNLRKVEERLLETLKIPDATELLNPPMEPTEQNAVNENAAASLGRPITAFPEQDHMAHIRAHIDYMVSPVFGMNPLIAPTLLPIMINHLKEHIALWYVSQAVETVDEALGVNVVEEMKEIGKDNETRRALDRALDAASGDAINKGQQVFARAMQVIAQAQQMVQQMQQQQMGAAMQDPRLQLEAQKIQQKGQSDAQKMQLEAQRLQQDGQIEQGRLQLEAQNMQLEAQHKAQTLEFDGLSLAERTRLEMERQDREDFRKRLDVDARMAMNDSDNATALQLAAAEIASGERIAVSTGTGINPTP